MIFSGEAEASQVSPDWHGWLHHTFEEPPEEGHLPRQAVGARPPAEHDRHARRPTIRRAASLLPTERARADGDYEAWRPE